MLLRIQPQLPSHRPDRITTSHCRLKNHSTICFKTGFLFTSENYTGKSFQRLLPRTATPPPPVLTVAPTAYTSYERHGTSDRYKAWSGQQSSPAPTEAAVSHRQPNDDFLRKRRTPVGPFRFPSPPEPPRAQLR